MQRKFGTGVVFCLGDKASISQDPCKSSVAKAEPLRTADKRRIDSRSAPIKRRSTARRPKSCGELSLFQLRGIIWRPGRTRRPNGAEAN